MFEPFEFEFMVRAMVAATLVGALTGAVGVFVVLRRLSYIGHGLAHSIFGGAVVSFVAGFNFYIGATIWGVLSALLINTAAQRRQIGGDAAVGIITTSAFAIGVLLISLKRSFTLDFDAALFGEPLGITNGDVWVIVGVTAMVGAMFFIWWKPLLFITFDRDVAGAYGVSVHWVEAMFALGARGDGHRVVTGAWGNAHCGRAGHPTGHGTIADGFVPADVRDLDHARGGVGLFRHLHLVVRGRVVGRDGRADAGGALRAGAELCDGTAAVETPRGTADGAAGRAGAIGFRVAVRRAIPAA